MFNNNQLWKERTQLSNYTIAQKKEIYEEAKRNNDEKKIKDLYDLKDKLELEWKKNNDKTAFEELKEYVEAPEHQDEEIVKQIKEAFKIYLEE